MSIVDTIIGNIDSDSLSLLSDKSVGKAGIAINAISEAMVKSDIRMFGSQFYRFNGKIYVPINKLEGVIMNVLRVIDPTGQLTSRHGSITSGVWKSISMSELLVDNSLICFKNCVLNMYTEKVMDFSPDIHVISQLGYNYEPSSKPVLWLKFLHEVLPDDDSILLLQEFLGSIFIDRRKGKIETMLFLLGSGANGKSVVFNTVIGVLGTQNVSNYEITELTNSADRGKNLIDINGKLLNYCSEVSARGFSSSNFKALVSGEPQQARPIYGMPTKVENIPIMMANANTMPTYKDMSDGVYRRIIILPFDKKIPEEKQDKELSSKMRAEYPAIMNWILDGRRRIVKNEYRFTISGAVRRAMDEYRGDNNSVYQFLDVNGYAPNGDGEPLRMTANELYEEYAKYCTISGLITENITNFGRTMANIGFFKTRMRNGNVYNLFE